MNKFVLPNELCITEMVHNKFILPYELLNLIILHEDILYYFLKIQNSMLLHLKTIIFPTIKCLSSKLYADFNDVLLINKYIIFYTIRNTVIHDTSFTPNCIKIITMHFNRTKYRSPFIKSKVSTQIEIYLSQIRKYKDIIFYRNSEGKVFNEYHYSDITIKNLNSSVAVTQPQTNSLSSIDDNSEIIIKLTYRIHENIAIEVYFDNNKEISDIVWKYKSQLSEHMRVVKLKICDDNYDNIMNKNKRWIIFAKMETDKYFDNKTPRKSIGEEYFRPYNNHINNEITHKINGFNHKYKFTKLNNLRGVNCIYISDNYYYFYFYTNKTYEMSYRTFQNYKYRQTNDNPSIIIYNHKTAIIKYLFYRDDHLFKEIIYENDTKIRENYYDGNYSHYYTHNVNNPAIIIYNGEYIEKYFISHNILKYDVNDNFGYITKNNEIIKKLSKEDILNLESKLHRINGNESYMSFDIKVKY